jgi:hypothetical protein
MRPVRIESAARAQWGHKRLRAVNSLRSFRRFTCKRVAGCWHYGGATGRLSDQSVELL